MPQTRQSEKQKKTKKLVLSDLILKGCKLDGPKITGKLFRIGPSGKINGACAIGAAYIGHLGKFGALQNYLGPIPQALYKESERLVDLLNKNSPPELARESGLEGIDGHVLQTVVVRFNDTLNWSRERIAKKLKEYGL